MFKPLHPLVCFLLLGVFAGPTHAQPESPDYDYLEIFREASATVEADYTEWVVDVATTGDSTEGSLKLNNQRFEKLIDGLEDAGVEQGDIASGSPVVMTTTSKPASIVNRVTRRLRFTLNDMEDIAEVSVLIKKLGHSYEMAYKASRFDHVQNELTVGLLKQMRVDAKAQAEALGQALGPAKWVNSYVRSKGGSLFAEEDEGELHNDSDASNEHGVIRLNVYVEVYFELSS